MTMEHLLRVNAPSLGSHELQSGLILLMSSLVLDFLRRLIGLDNSKSRLEHRSPGPSEFSLNFLG